MVGVLVGRDESELRARVRDQLEMLGHGADDPESERWLAERRRRWIMGTPDEARTRVREFAAAGVQRIMLQDFLPRDLDMVSLLGEVFVR
jgi:alkanesulfonate monooxygenase SsuD/methylene tetrahydromethanopterin reductase-like flavin-dependent oxidoreductase (luciferase family)